MIVDIGFSGVEGIVFDAVGTLILPRPSVAEAYTQAGWRQGVTLHELAVRERFHEQFQRAEIDDLGDPLATSEEVERGRWRQIVAGCLPEVADPERAFEELWVHFGDPLSWVVFPDVAPAVERLRIAGLRICVGSNFDGRLRSVVAGLAALKGLEASLVISSEVGYRKPHARFYEAACEHLGLPANRVLFVGDHPENDFRGPIRAGFRAARIERGSPPRDNPPTFRGLAEFADHLVAALGRE